MRARQVFSVTAVVLALLGVSAPILAQQMTIHTPYHTLGDSFFENAGVSWSGHWGGVNFSYGGGALSAPPFGGYDPNAGTRLNLGYGGKDWNFNLATSYGQGYRQSYTSQTPAVTIMNGQTGYFSDTSQRPFVVSVVPVVGAFPVVPNIMPQAMPESASTVNPRIQALLQSRADEQDRAAAQTGDPRQPPPAPPPPHPAAPPRDNPAKAAEPVAAAIDPGDAAAMRLNEAQQSSAGRPAPCVAEAKRLHQQEQGAADEEFAALMVRAQALEEDGKPNVAKIYYQRIAKHATGPLQEQARQKLYAIGKDKQ